MYIWQEDELLANILQAYQLFIFPNIENTGWKSWEENLL